MENKQQIVLFGGSFNPPTIAHLQAAQYVLDNCKEVDGVRFLPCYQSLYNKKLVSAEHRINMLNLMCKYDSSITTWDYEIKNQFTGASIEFVEKLLKEPFAEKYDFSIMIGLDNALKLDKWVKPKELQKLIRFIVIPRKGYRVEDRPEINWYLKSPHIYLNDMENPIMDISSTIIRNAIKNNEDISKWVFTEVQEYIFQNNLYGN